MVDVIKKLSSKNGGLHSYFVTPRVLHRLGKPGETDYTVFHVWTVGLCESYGNFVPKPSSVRKFHASFLLKIIGSLKHAAVFTAFHGLLFF